MNPNTNCDIDRHYMETALHLAWQGRFSTSPNPRVGCVIVRGEEIVGQGYHIMAGGPHAEIHALNQAGNLARNATAYVTLEPCSHTGRTGPCALALTKAGIKRVVVAMTDPNPLVAGRGVALLQAAGVDVTVGLCATQARELNRGFLSRMERQQPFIRLKTATSADGKTALSDGRSQWITGEAARQDVQYLRAESCAVLTGSGTVFTDNPRLNVRLFNVLRQPTRIILDSQLRTPLHSHVIQDSASPTILATTVTNAFSHQPYLDHPHVDVLVVDANAQGHIDLNQLWPLLAQRGMGEILVEAGHTLNGALLQGGWVDEVVLYQAPKWLGSTAQEAFRLPENAQSLTQNRWHTTSVDQMGNDIKWTLRHNS